MIAYSSILLRADTKQIFDQIHLNLCLLQMLIRVFNKSFLLKAPSSFGIDACFFLYCYSIVDHFLNYSLIYASLINLGCILNSQGLPFYDFMH